MIRRLIIGVSIVFMLCGQAAFGEDTSEQRKIVGGEIVTDTGAYPWITAIISYGANPAYSGQFCGGALIHPNWVLTAGHCIKNESTGEVESPENIQVIIGEYDLLNGTGGERIDVKTVIPHPYFADGNANTPDSDIALLELETPSTATPIKPYDGTDNLIGVTGTAIGWGSTSGYNIPAEDNPHLLRHVSFPIISPTLCESSLTTNGSGIPYDTSMVCAGSDGKDSCFGDSGGPLIFTDGLEKKVAGVVSFGYGEDCAEPGIYGVYARVSSLIDFVNQYVPQNTTECGIAGDFTQDGILDIADIIGILQTITSNRNTE